MAKLGVAGVCGLIAAALSVLLILTGNVVPVLFVLISCVLGVLACTFVCFHDQGRLARQKLDGTVGKLLLKLAKAKSSRLQQAFTWNYNTGTRKLSHFEVEKLIQLIMRDFVKDWHSQFSQDDHFPSECKHLLETFAGSVEERMSQLNMQLLLCDVVSVTARHLCALNDIGLLAENAERRQEKRTQAILISHNSAVEHFLKLPNSPTHPALASKESELRYMKACLDCACEVSIPDSFKRCSAARYFMRELLATHLLRPILDLLCDPDFLMMAIIATFRKSPIARLQAIRLEMERENEEILKRKKKKSRQQGGPVEGKENQSVLLESTLVSTPSSPETLLAQSQLPDQEYSSSGPLSGDVGISSCQLVETSESKPFVGYVVNFPASALPPGALEELGLSTGQETGVLQALTRFSDYDTLQRSLKGNQNTAEAASRLNFPDKANLSAFLSRIPVLKNTQKENSFMESRKAHLEKYLHVLWSQPELRKSEALMQFLKTGVLRYKWHLQPAATNGGSSRRKSLPLGGAMAAESAGGTAQRPKRQSQEVISAFLNAQLPIAYRTASPSSESLPLGNVEPHTLLHSVTRGETPVEDLTASMVLVRNHIQLNEMQHSRVRASGALSRETGAANESALASAVANGPNKTTTEESSFGPKEFLNFAHDALRFRFPSVLRRPEKVLTDGRLTNSLLCLANEAARPVCSGLWLCRERVQRALLAVMGGALDRTLLALLEEVTADDENWARMLYHLRHTLWPNGVLDLSPWQPLSYPEKRQLRQQALTEIKNFLPDVFPYLVGSENYTAVLQHGLDSLENPTLNRHLLLHIVDVLMLHFIPELGSEGLVAAINKDGKAS